MVDQTILGIRPEEQAQLITLAERCEKATGPDHELAKDIFRAVFPDRVPSPIVTSGYGWREDDGGWWLATGEDARTVPKYIYPPHWLSSINDAITLVPEGWEWALYGPSNDHGPCAQLETEAGRIDWEEPIEGIAATPALALCAAALRAKVSPLSSKRRAGG